MTATREIVFAVSASWFSRLVTIILGLTVVPVLFRNLGRDELGIWILLVQTSSVLAALDFGFASTLTRKIALAKGMSGGVPSISLNEDSTKLIADLVATGKRTYQAIAICAFVIAFSSGVYYLTRINVEGVSLTTVLVAWGVLCASYSITVLSSIWTSLLQGIGYVGWDSLVTSFASSITLLGQILCVTFGGGIVSLAIVVSLGALLQRFLIVWSARKRRPQVFQYRGVWNSTLFRSMVSPSLRSWITGLSWVIILHTDSIFIAKILGAATIPLYRAAYMIFMNINNLSVTAGASSTVFVSQLWQSGRRDDARRIVLRNLRLGLGLMSAGGAFVIVMDHRLFDVWLGAGNFVGSKVMIVLFLVFFLETQCQIVTAGSRATEDEAFALSSFIAATLKIFLTIYMGMLFGIIGIALSTLIAQGLTNYWYMVYRGLKRLEINRLHFLWTVLMPTVLLFIVVSCGARLVIVSQVFEGLLELAATATVTGIILVAFTWVCILESTQRQRITQWTGLTRTLGNWG